MSKWMEEREAGLVPQGRKQSLEYPDVNLTCRPI